MRFKKGEYAAEDAGNRIFKPFLGSLAGHLILFGVILFNPEWSRKPDEYFPSVIDVRMVDLTDVDGGAPVKKTETMNEAPAPIEKKAPKETAAEVETPAPEPEVKPEISISESKPKSKKKVALKYKTFKSKKVLKSALQNLEKQVEQIPPRPLEEALKKIREDVAEKEKNTVGSNVPGGSGNEQSQDGKYASGSKQESDLIEIYNVEISQMIRENWAFPDQFANGNKKLLASLAFKVFPDGHIEDIWFHQRSGNPHLDDSAMKAIIKSSPVKPHPPGLNLPFVVLGLTFTPQGILRP